jgi:Protein of unknown function (DUF3237)
MQEEPMTTPRTELFFTIHAICTPPEEMGRVKGGLGRMIPIIGGSVSGPKLIGEVMPGADWFVTHDNGLAEVNARYAIRTDDGTVIQVFNGAVARIAPVDSPQPMVTHPRFIAPEGPHDWLNEGLFVGVLTPDISIDQFAVNIAVYRVTAE